MPSSVNLIFCADRKVLHGAKVMLRSALYHLREGWVLNIRAFSIDLSPEDIDSISSSLQALKKPFSFDSVKVDPRALFVTEKLRPHYGGFATYLKLVLPTFNEDRNPILYLDTDIVVCTDLATLVSSDLGGKIVGVVEESEVAWALEGDFYLAHGLERQSRYFNAGVMLVDTARWKEDDVSAECLDFLYAHGLSALAADQTIMNIVLRGRFASLSRVYNQLVYPGSPPVDPESANGIYHLVGRPKPWQLLGEWINGQSSLFYKYLDMTPDRGWRSFKHIDIPSLLAAARVSRSYYKEIRRLAEESLRSNRARASRSS
jgi:lipopolysaccharide biosynthesis glycosyltransferase